MKPPNRIALSIDVEDWYHSRHVASSEPNANERVMDFKRQYDQAYRLLDKPIRQLLEMFARFDIKATFFIVADLIEDNRALFTDIVRAGHEIGCHGLHHLEYRGAGDKAEQALFYQNTQEAKARLEDLSGVPVIGYRAPSAYFRRWMIAPLLKLGFAYDASIATNSLYNKLAEENFPKTTVPFDLEGLFELPWPYWSIGGYRFPAGGGPIFRYFGGFPARMGLSQSLKRGDTSFYLHPHDISTEPLPAIIQATRRRFWYNRGEKTWRRFERLLTHFQGDWCRCMDVYYKVSGERAHEHG